ncbi:MAG: hypothetical protein ACOC7V_15235 [Spirochaetota bacterium]
MNLVFRTFNLIAPLTAYENVSFALSLIGLSDEEVRDRTMGILDEVGLTGAIAVGLATFIFIDGWFKGADLPSQRTVVWYETGAARVADAEYRENRDGTPLRYAVEEPRRLLARLEALGVPATPRITCGGDLRSAGSGQVELFIPLGPLSFGVETRVSPT